MLPMYGVMKIKMQPCVFNYEEFDPILLCAIQKHYYHELAASAQIKWSQKIGLNFQQYHIKE